MLDIKRLRFPLDIILVCIRWYAAYPLSYPGGTFAYVANFGSNNVLAYSINATTGALTPVTGSPFTAGSGPNSVVAF